MSDLDANRAQSVRQRLLDAPPPKIIAYTRESVVAEKLEAMASLGDANSRMKDFADVFYLSKHFDFDGATLSQAVSNTFDRRVTLIVREPLVFTEQFIHLDHKQVQWNAFLRRSNPENIPDQFEEVVAGITAFLGPVLAHLADGDPAPGTWVAGGPWWK